jgi:trk system potassium uptake protein TrkA
MGRYAVVGLGSFGATVARSLFERGNEVVGVDSSRQRVQELRDSCTDAIEADATDFDTLKSLGIASADAVVISLGERMDASVLATLHLKDLGARRIVVKAVSDDHGEILRRVGATRVIHPERDTARHLSLQLGLGLRTIVEYMPLAADSSLVELKTPAAFVGKTLAELGLPKRFGVLVVAVKQGDALALGPGAEQRIASDDVLVLVGRDDDIDRLAREDA